LFARRSDAARLAPVVGCALGLLAGAGVALVQHASYTSTSTVVVGVQGLPAAGAMGPTGADVAATVAALARSGTAIDNVAAAEHLDASTVRSHLRASVVEDAALVRLRYTDRSRDRAAAVVQEAGSVLRALVVSQFASGPRKLSVAQVDPPRTKRESHPVGRGALLGALIGAAAGFLVGRIRRERPAAAAPAEPGPGDCPRDPAEPPLPPAAELAPLEPEPVRPRGPREVPELVAVRRALAEHGHEFDPDEVTFWEAYAGGLEAQAVDRRLPERLRALIPDVFGPLLARANAPEP
jgi:hypothetical protein